MRYLFIISSLLLCALLKANETVSSSSELLNQEAAGTNWFMQLFGFGMWPLWILSIVLIMLVIERRKALQRDLIIDEKVLDSCIEQLGNNDIASAINTCKQSKARLCIAWAQGLQTFTRKREPIASVLTTNATLALKPLKRNVTAITTIGVIAPLLGLLGTVIGMIMTFAQIEATGGADKGALAGGISVALFTTAGGLIIAIPAIVASRFFNNKIVNYAEEIELAINRAEYSYEEALHQAQDNSTTAEQASESNTAEASA